MGRTGSEGRVAGLFRDFLGMHWRRLTGDTAGKREDEADATITKREQQVWSLATQQAGRNSPRPVPKEFYTAKPRCSDWGPKLAIRARFCSATSGMKVEPCAEAIARAWLVVLHVGAAFWGQRFKEPMPGLEGSSSVFGLCCRFRSCLQGFLP